MENRPADPGSIQGSHRPTSFIRIKHRARANDIFRVKLSVNNHIVGFVHKNHTSKYYYERVWCTTQLAKLSFNHSNGRTQSWRFSTFLIKNWKTSAVSTTTVVKWLEFVWCCERSPILPVYIILMIRRRPPERCGGRGPRKQGQAWMQNARDGLSSECRVGARSLSFDDAKTSRRPDKRPSTIHVRKTPSPTIR